MTWRKIMVPLIAQSGAEALEQVSSASFLGMRPGTEDADPQRDSFPRASVMLWWPAGPVIGAQGRR